MNIKGQNFNRRVILIASLTGILACIGDIMAMFISASLFPGYNQLRQTMSMLGSSASPVGRAVSIWWIILGLLFSLFAIGFRIVFAKYGKNIIHASWMIIIYGLGEGFFSGLFPGNHINGRLTNVGIIHDIFGGFGVVAVMILPFLLLKAFTVNKSRSFSGFSLFIGILGVTFFGLFSVSRFLPARAGIFSYIGMWQRFFLVNYYLYFIVLGVKMINHYRNAESE